MRTILLVASSRNSEGSCFTPPSATAKYNEAEDMLRLRYFVRAEGIEPPTLVTSRRCSTTELSAQITRPTSHTRFMRRLLQASSTGAKRAINLLNTNLCKRSKLYYTSGMVQDEHLLGERAMPPLAVEILEDLEADPGVASNPKIYPPSFLQGLARRAARLASAEEREALIASVLEGRREVVFHSPHHTHSSDPHVSVDKIPRAVSEFMERYQKGAYRFVGIGKSGVVLSSKRFAGRCHKIRLPLSPQPDGTNSVEQEYDMQKRIASMPTTSRVRVPVADTLLPEYGGIIVMDKVRGITIRDILLGQEKVPPEFDVGALYARIANVCGGDACARIPSS